RASGWCPPSSSATSTSPGSGRPACSRSFPADIGPRGVHMRKYTTEFIGTFFLVFTICATVLSGTNLAPLAIGLVLAAMAFAGGGVSGGVFNPAVAVGVSTAGLVSWSMLWVYVVANLAGGVLAAVAFRALNLADLEAPKPVEELEGEVVSRSLPMSGFKKA